MSINDFCAFLDYEVPRELVIRRARAGALRDCVEKVNGQYVVIMDCVGEDELEALGLDDEHIADILGLDDDADECDVFEDES